MARIEGVTDAKASFIIRALFWLARRKLGRVSEMWRICAHVPKIQARTRPPRTVCSTAPHWSTAASAGWASSRPRCFVGCPA